MEMILAQQEVNLLFNIYYYVLLDSDLNNVPIDRKSTNSVKQK